MLTVWQKPKTLTNSSHWCDVYDLSKLFPFSTEDNSNKTVNSNKKKDLNSYI